MTTMTAAFKAVDIQPSTEVQAELDREQRNGGGREVAPGVTFKSNFDVASLLAGIIGEVDCRVYLEGTDWQKDNKAVWFIEQYLRANPELGSMEASVPDITRVEIATDPLKGTKWAGIICRNATVAWDVTAAIRSIGNWPVTTGKITSPKVEQLFYQND